MDMTPKGKTTAARKTASAADPQADSQAEAETRDKPRVEAVERALSVLEAFADGTPRMPLSEISARTGFYPSTVLRLFHSLEHFGYLHRDDDGFFRLGPSLWRLGVLYQNTFDLERHVRPVLDRLVERLGETAAFYIRESDRRICLYRRFAASSIGHHVEEGAELPMDRGASAHVLMAFTGAKGAKYDAVRRDGLYVSYGERNPDANAIAVPVHGQGDAFVGALSIIGPVNRLVGATIDKSIPVLQEASQALARSLRGR